MTGDHPESFLYPLFVRLNKKKVLIVGAGKVAGRKIPELLRCGAQITVLAPIISSEIQRLSGQINILKREYRKGDENGKYVVFACTHVSRINRQVSENCRLLNIPCNIVDQGQYGDFHSPAVIRRGPLIFALGSGGLAPGLTRFLKEFLERILPEGLESVAAKAIQFRKSLVEVSKKTGKAIPYRQMLQIAKLKSDNDLEEFIHNWIEEKNQSSTPVGNISGKVVLAGAGPGHPGLITKMALDMIGQADVILYDRLIPTSLLIHAKADCTLLEAGKRGHFASVRQEQIEHWMVQHAKEGKLVLRLKGGDPMVFGRGWEEIKKLEDNQIPWQIIPGISSALACPAWAGIPITLRGLSRSFAVMSGMALSKTNLDIPQADTIVVLMGYYRLPELVQAFLKKGWKPTTPAAAIESGTTSAQRVCKSDLINIASQTAKMGFDSPVLIVVGEVANLQHSL